jgi:hypothetical protein
LIIMGILLQKQPLYIKGPTDPNAAAQGCYQGGTAFYIRFNIIIISLLSYHYYHIIIIIFIVNIVNIVVIIIIANTITIIIT